MCAACTDLAVTGRDACTGHLVHMCVACTDSAVTGRDVFTGRHVRMCVCLSVLGCCVSLQGAWLSLYKLYVSPKVHLYRSHASSAECVRFATVDHAARLPFCTKDYTSLFTHPSCEAGAWFGSSMG